jgi:DNA-binding SARP family transcriptional activator/tetratricopeptide (TPR) repeat protein
VGFPRPEPRLYFRTLGPLAVEAHGCPVALGGEQRQTVLAVLLAKANSVVSADYLTDALWSDQPPASCRVQLQGLISDLRRRLAPGQPRSEAPIETRAPGYLLRLAPAASDMLEFRDELASGRAAVAAGDLGRAISLLGVALGRWRGPAFAGITAGAVEIEAMLLNEEQLAATAELIDARLADGRLAGLAAQLRRLVAANPLHERFHYQLMTVCHRTGQQADALVVYHGLQRRIVRELGVQPSGALQELHQLILRTDSAGPLASELPGIPRATAYRQLPADTTAFAGRAAQLSQLMTMCLDRHPTAPAIAVIDGMGGIGKTRLALRAAHQLVADGHFADGQLWVDLRGFAPGVPPADPAEVLDGLLRLLGVPAAGIPAELEAKVAVYRDRLAGQRVLIVLDNAAEEAQIAPLLPGCPASTVLITSRRGLAVLGAGQVSLEVFTAAEALALLRAVIGDARISADPAAAQELISLCGFLPLAVSLAAQRLRARPAWDIPELIRRLRPAGSRLAELTAGEQSVASVLSLSYEVLPPECRRVFRQLGHHPGHDFTAASVAAFAGLDLNTSDRILETLLDQRLLQQVVSGRYQLHDLVRAYALRLGDAVIPAQARQAAVTGLLDWYCLAATTAMAHVRRFALPVSRDVQPSAVPMPELTSRPEALAWLDAERANLLAAIQVAAGDWPEHAIRIPHELQPYLIHRGYLEPARSALLIAAAAARQLGDQAALGLVLTGLGQVCSALGQAGEAEAHLRQAARLNQEAGDSYAAATALNHLAASLRDRGEYAAALDHYRVAAAIFTRIGEPARLASTLSNLAVNLHLMGDNEEAVELAEKALAVAQRGGDASVASLRTNLGHLYARLGRHVEAIAHTVAALQLHREAGSLAGECIATTNLSFVLNRAGRPADAMATGRQAVQLARRRGDSGLIADALNALGEACYDVGQHEAALGHHQEALGLLAGSGNVEEVTRASDGVGRNQRRLPGSARATASVPSG